MANSMIGAGRRIGSKSLKTSEQHQEYLTGRGQHPFVLAPPKAVLLAARSADLKRRRQSSSLRQPGKS